MKKICFTFLFCGLIIISHTALAVLLPKYYERHRIFCSAVYLGQVTEVHQVQKAAYSYHLKATIKIAKTFRGTNGNSDPSLATVLYEELREGKSPPLGGTLYYSLKPGETVLVFASSFDEGNLHGTANGDDAQIAEGTKNMKDLLEKEGKDSMAETGVTQQQYDAQLALYNEIQDYFKNPHSEKPVS